MAWRLFLLLSTQAKKGRQMKKNNYDHHLSRVKTPWDDDPDITESESYILDKYKEHYYSHHPKLAQSDEYKIINSFSVYTCPYCESSDIAKRGFTSNHIQRYWCLDCHKTFTILTGTIFQDHKISISEWIEYLLDLFNYSSISLTSKVNKNAFTTSKYWLSKVFLLLEDYQDDIILKGDVIIDETYYTVIKKDITSKNGKKLRGISRNQYCIATAKDDDHIYLSLEGLGKPSKHKTLKAYKDHIEPRSRLLHDDEN